MMTLRRRGNTGTALAVGAMLAFVLMVRAASVAASTYVVFIPLDSSIYGELDTLNDLGVLDSYMPEIKPISRVEAARLVLEAEGRLFRRGFTPLASRMVRALRMQLAEEIGWLERDTEDVLPTMIHPVERVEAQYVFSRGRRRSIFSPTRESGINFREATPLLANNDDLSTASGSNEVLRWSGWLGLGGFITGYGEGAVAGPLSRNVDSSNRGRLLTGAVVVGLGNVAVSFGQEEMAWGVGHFGLLSQSNNARPFAALRVQNIHPSHLPGILRYLGLFRWQAFFGQLDGNRKFSRPWIDGQIFSFKPLPSLEFGFTHTVMFGGRSNDSFGLGGFLGRATGLFTGDPLAANTNSRVGIYVSARIASLRNMQFYGEILGEDFFQPFGPSLELKTPFKAPSYQIGLYLPRLTDDGLTSLRFEYLLLDRVYSLHNDSLYWTYDNVLMGNQLGPGAWQIHVELGRWIDYQSKLELDFSYTERIPLPGLSPSAGARKERSEGIGIELLHLPVEVGIASRPLGEFRLRAAIEYVQGINYSDRNSLRTLFQLTVGLSPSWPSTIWK